MGVCTCVCESVLFLGCMVRGGYMWGIWGGIWEPSAFNCDLVHDVLGDNLFGHARPMLNMHIAKLQRLY